MNDKMKTVREALTSTTGIRNALYNLCQRFPDQRHLMDEVHKCDMRIAEALAALDSMEAEAGEVVAWIRKWAYDKDEGTRTNRPVGWTLKEVTIAKLLPNDVPLYAHAKAHGEVELTEDDLEEISHSWANAEPPWPGPLERTYARTVFKDGLRHLASKYRLIPR